jgi:hypothetical protein
MKPLIKPSMRLSAKSRHRVTLSAESQITHSAEPGIDATVTAAGQDLGRPRRFDLPAWGPARPTCPGSYRCYCPTGWRLGVVASSHQRADAPLHSVEAFNARVCDFDFGSSDCRALGFRFI